jgi:hypothetical protein
MYEKLVREFREKICTHCESNDKCQKKPNKMAKCGVLYLVSKT